MRNGTECGQAEADHSEMECWTARATSCIASRGNDSEFRARLREQMATLSAIKHDRAPHYTEDGYWKVLPVETRSSTVDGHYEHGNWTAGFTVGLLWLAGCVRGSDEIADEAANQSARGRLRALSARADDATTHDLGFLFYPSFSLGFALGRLSLEGVSPAFMAARQLALRFNERTQLLQAFGPIGDSRLAGTSTIDTMMNLPLLFWADQWDRSGRLHDRATTHARTSARLYFREDGSSYHLIQVDPLSGRLEKRGTFQGRDDRSCWSRGQGWAVCGFAWAYAVTGEAELLEAAERAARYFFCHLPDSGVPPWDFSVAGASEPVDASASAAVALGCLIIEAYHTSPYAQAAYGGAGRVLLDCLRSSCLGGYGQHDGLLLQSCYSRPHCKGVNGATAWGDFYYAAAESVRIGTLTISELVFGRGDGLNQNGQFGASGASRSAKNV